MPKLSKRRPALHDGGRITVPNMSAAPRKVSFEASEDGADSSSACSSPKLSLSPPRSPSMSSTSSIHRCKSERTSLRRPEPSFCLSSMVMTPSPENGCDQSLSPISTASEESAYAWGQFVDVIPASTSGDEHTDVAYHHGSSDSELYRSSYEPYKRPPRRQLKHDRKRKGFLPGFVLTIPPLPPTKEKSSKESSNEEHVARDFVLAMKRMRV